MHAQQSSATEIVQSTNSRGCICNPKNASPTVVLFRYVTGGVKSDDRASHVGHFLMWLTRRRLYHYIFYRLEKVMMLRHALNRQAVLTVIL